MGAMIKFVFFCLVGALRVKLITSYVLYALYHVICSCCVRANHFRSMYFVGHSQ